MATEKQPQYMLESYAPSADGHSSSVAPSGASSVSPSSEGAHAAHGGHDPLDPAGLIGHVQDSDHFQLPRMVSPETQGRIDIPQLRESTEPIVQIPLPSGLSKFVEPLDLKITKFMVLEVVAALILCAIFIPLANRAKSGRAPRGRFWNMFEAMVVFVREQIARPAIGSEDGDRFAPFIMTLFFFILTCNLLGLVPWAGSPTGSLAVTGSLALITYLVMLAAGTTKFGALGYLKAQVPHMEVPWVVGIVLKPMIFAIELGGMAVKHFVLAMRLLANMMGGHTVVAVLTAFIAAVAAAGYSWAAIYLGVAPPSILGSVALNLLELFVAFLQAYIFAFLAALFIGMALHPH